MSAILSLFFQAEDGIRDLTVTGVQTCALPISDSSTNTWLIGLAASPINQVLVEESVLGWGEFELEVMRDRNDNVVRSEERREGKRVDLGGRRIIKKKNRRVDAV